ncbi:hypothetical protein PIB30_066978, partial [Stylosanthes scabra]|nr:hypothetical protein [Stylosanthes scabra]
AAGVSFKVVLLKNRGSLKLFLSILFHAKTVGGVPRFLPNLSKMHMIRGRGSTVSKKSF